MSWDIGKIEDAGRLVEGGAVDRYWDSKEINILPFQYTGNSTVFQSKWLYNPQLALEHFGLRSIEFGNWMNQKDRANFLYASMLGLHQLALIFGVSDRLIGLGGKLSIALGARGKGRAAGHYERLPYSVINITKPHGRNGVLAHEYAHALDNIISFYTKSKQTFVSGGQTTRKGYDELIAESGNYFEQQFEELFNLLYYNQEGEKTRFHKAIEKRDEYWNRRNEVFARTFEVYISERQRNRQLTNIFLSPQSFSKEYPTARFIEGGISRHIGNIISKGFEVMRKNADQASLNGIDLPIVGYKGFRATIKEKASLSDTLKNMKRIAERDTYQVRELAKELEGNSVEETSRNIWDFIRENLTYRLDTEGIEELRTPSRTLHDKIFDCDDATILTSAILLNLGISHEYRITAYKEKGKFSHIYPVAFDEEGRSYVIDAVPEIPHFNYEEQPIIDLKTVRMELHELSGVKEAVSQEEMKQDLLGELNEPFSLSGYEDEEDDMLLESTFLSGLGEVDNADEADVIIESKSDALQLIENGILAEVHKALQTLKKEQQSPTVLSETIDVEKEKLRLQSLIESWDDEQAREEIIEEALDENSSYKNFYQAIRMSLEELSSESNELSGADDDEPIYLARIEAVDLSDMIEGEEGYFDDELSGRRSRRRARRRKFFKKIGKKVGNTIKKIGEAVVRFNPATIALRNATLLVLKLNLFNIASNVIYGYLTRDEAIAKNLDLNEWSKVVSAKNKLEKFFTKAGGKSKNFRNAVIRGRAAKKTGIHLSGLGEATAAASTAAASGFIVFAKKVLSAINPVTLFKKVKSSIQARKAAKNVSSKSAINNGRPQNMQNEFNSGAANSTAVNQTAANDWEAAANQSGKDGILQKIKNIWITHKKKAIGVGIMVVVTIVFLLVWGKYKKKKKRQLAGIKAARTRARNRKAASRRLPARRTPTKRKSTRAKRRTTSSVKTLGRGNTTVVRTPSKGRGKTRVYKQSSKSRLSLMHAKAKQLQKKHPKTKYSNLLKMAAKQI